MKNKFTLLFLSVALTSTIGRADAEYKEGFKPITNAAFHSRFKVRGELYIVDESGTKLLAPTSEAHEWTPGPKADKLEMDWNVSGGGFKEIALHQIWRIKADNSLEVTLRQYEHSDMDRSGALPRKIPIGKLIREETQTIQNFSPISWVAQNENGQRVILRLSPIVDQHSEEKSLDRLPIGGNRGTFTVTDNQGYLWGENVRFGGVLVGITSHRGSFIISLYPFEKAKPLGAASGRFIELNIADDLKVKLVNESDIVPDGMRVTVYGRYYPNIKTSHPNSVSSFGQSDIRGFPKEFE